jgi:multidrug efflux pump
MAKFFIDRPVFAWVIALFILLAGILSIPNLPVSQYPQIAPPSIVVTSIYPGASAQTVDESVTSLIEQEMNGVENLLYIESQSQSDGQSQVTVTFKTGTNPELAAVDVQNRLKACRSALATSCGATRCDCFSYP